MRGSTVCPTKSLKHLHTTFISQKNISHLHKQKKKVYIALLDVKKAFNTVWHVGLFHKLQKVGITRQALDFIGQLYDHSTMECASPLNQHQSRSETRWGSFTPFSSLYVNSDLLVELENSGLGARVGDIYTGAPMYADNLALIATSPE